MSEVTYLWDRNRQGPFGRFKSRGADHPCGWVELHKLSLSLSLALLLSYFYPPSSGASA